MPEANRPVPRVLVGAVMSVKSRTIEELGKGVAEAVRAAGFQLVRNVIVNGEAQFIQQLTGGTGFGPRDATCEAIDSFVERRIEGFAEAYRHMLRDHMEHGADSWLARATAGVYNQCLVFALTGRAVDVTAAIRTLVVPTLSDAVELATGRMRAVQIHT
jgi:molybdopterin biosynthesis enzyme MoaB